MRDTSLSRAVRHGAVAAQSLPNLRSVALRRYAVAASDAWALFGALAGTAVDRLDLLECCVSAADMDVEAYATATKRGLRLIAMASEASDGVAAIALIHLPARDIGLTGGSWEGLFGREAQPEPSARRIADDKVDMLAIDHFSTARIPVLATSRKITRLFVQCRSAADDFDLVDALSICFDAPAADAPRPFAALKSVLIRVDHHFSTYRDNDGGLGDHDVSRLGREIAALERKIEAELDRRATQDNRHWSKRTALHDADALMSGIIQPGIHTYVRR